MVGEPNENDLWPISDRISGTMRRILLADLRGGWDGALTANDFGAF